MGNGEVEQLVSASCAPWPVVADISGWRWRWRWRWRRTGASNQGEAAVARSECPLGRHLIVLRMRQYVADVNAPKVVSHVHDEPILVAPDVEHGFGLTEEARRREVSLHLAGFPIT